MFLGAATRQLLPRIAAVPACLIEPTVVSRASLLGPLLLLPGRNVSSGLSCACFAMQTRVPVNTSASMSKRRYHSYSASLIGLKQIFQKPATAQVSFFVCHVKIVELVG